MEIGNVHMQVNDFFKNFLGKEGNVIKITKKEEEWETMIEVPEEKEYTKKHAKTDLKAVYRVLLNRELEIVSYNKIKVIEKGVPFDEEDSEI